MFQFAFDSFVEVLIEILSLKFYIDTKTEF